MPAPSDSRQLAAAVRQNALASRLMGVDFVPVYRSRRSGGAEGGASDSVHEPDRSMNHEGAEAKAVVAPAAVEVKAARPVANPAAGRAPVVQSAATVDSAALIPEPAAIDYSGDPRRAAAAAALQKVRDLYDADAPHQHFVTDHHSIVFGEGDPCARLVFVGEAPGADEDRTGRPFVGRAGQLLTKMINAMGLRREEVYITNVLKTRPPNNATPTLEEARLCAPYLFQQLEIIRPEVIVTLGLPATRLLLETDQSMGSLRGRWSGLPRAAFPTAVMPTYHPAFLLRSYTKENREKVWSDLQKVMERLGLAANSTVPG